jgi:hypothetical protein
MDAIRLAIAGTPTALKVPASGLGSFGAGETQTIKVQYEGKSYPVDKIGVAAGPDTLAGFVVSGTPEQREAVKQTVTTGIKVKEIMNGKAGLSDTRRDVKEHITRGTNDIETIKGEIASYKAALIKAALNKSEDKFNHLEDLVKLLETALNNRRQELAKFNQVAVSIDGSIGAITG